LGGLRTGEMILVGARPGMGKTSFAWRLCRAAAEAGRGVVLFSLEMAARQIGARAVADLAFDRFGPVAYFDLLNGSGSRHEAAVAAVLPRFRTLPIVIDDRARLTPAAADSAAR